MIVMSRFFFFKSGVVRGDVRFFHYGIYNVCSVCRCEFIECVHGFRVGAHDDTAFALCHTADDLFRGFLRRGRNFRHFFLVEKSVRFSEKRRSCKSGKHAKNVRSASFFRGERLGERFERGLRRGIRARCGERAKCGRGADVDDDGVRKRCFHSG